ncbi:D-alanyl-D-alanine carboxypeptidase family protein [Clostridium sp. BSD2780061688st1 H5]|uniref:D-alanyl-D-alanine carboxypeptidase family protein n=1 Tax=Eubacteriales TaxID=186802 RepID=UPI00325B0FA9
MRRIKRAGILLAPVLLFIWLAFCPSMRGMAAGAGEGETPEELAQLYARSAVLMDADSGRVLFGKDADTARPMASTTKIMTCILALETADLEMECSVSEEAASQPEVRLGVREGETYRLEDLLCSLMLESHNDSAVVIAENTAGSVEKFAGMMNRKAEEIGCRDTYFITPNGLDASDGTGIHSTTAADLARILKYCITQSPKRTAFLDITGKDSYTFTDLSGQRSFSLQNHNAFLTMMEGALTGKTGFTADAGYCYVGALENRGRTFIVALLACGWPGNKGYKWEDTKKLMQYGIDHYQYETVTLDRPLPALPVSGGAPPSGTLEGEALALLASEPIQKEFLLAENETVTASIDLPEKLTAPVTEGQEVGSIRYCVGDFPVAEQKVTAAAKVPERSALWCFSQVCARYFAGKNKINQ